MNHSDIHGPAMHRELFNMVLGTKLGKGLSRTVWSSHMFPGSVVKVEDAGGKFQNITEWQTWEAIKHTEHAKWFAPCEYISPNGSILVMKRTEPVPRAQYPDRLPSFMTDTKFANYGMLDGRFVCHDYGFHLLLEKGMNKRMVAAHWWDA